MTEYYFYEPSQGHGLAHNPFNSIIAPRPIGWISTVGYDGHYNLAPYSFFNAFNYVPPIIGFSSVGNKDSLKNIRENPEFVWNLATRPLAEQVNLTSAMVDRSVDEAILAKLEMTPSRLVAPPRVSQSPAAFECRMSQIIQLQSAAGEKVESWLILGEVIGVWIDPAMMENGVYVTERAEPILRGGGPADYFVANGDTKFEMHRPDENEINAASR